MVEKRPGIRIVNGAYSETIKNKFKLFSEDVKIISDNYNLHHDDFNLLVLCGGADVSPVIYKEENTHSIGYNLLNDLSQINLINTSLRLGKKIFGICRGHQIINVALGSKMIQDLKVINKEHKIEHRIFGDPKTKGIVPEFFNNIISMHHQAIKYPGAFLNATSFYGGIIESTENEQIITVQFHPETQPENDFFGYLTNWSMKESNLYKGCF